MEHFELIVLITSFVLPLIMALSISISCKRLCSRVMVLVMLNAALVFLFNYLYFEHEFLLYSYIHSLHIGTVLWLYPSIYIYVRSVIRHRIEVRTLFHLLPGIFFLVLSAILFYGYMHEQERIYYLTNYRNESVHFKSAAVRLFAVIRLVDVGVILLQVIYYSIAIVRLVNRYQHEIAEEYAELSAYSMIWVKRMVYFFLVIGILFIIYYSLNSYSKENSLVLMILLFLVSTFMWILGLISVRLRMVPMAVALQTTELVPPKLPCDEINVLLMKLEKYMENEKPYLNSAITLTSISRKIGTNRSYLSSLINQHYGMNFNMYINRYRAAFALELSRQMPNMKKEDICEQSGFGSMATMKRALACMNKNCN